MNGDKTVRTTLELGTEQIVRSSLIRVPNLKTSRESTLQVSQNLTNVYHCVHIHQFVEEHEFDGDESVVLCPHVPNVVVELTRDSTQLLKYVSFGSEPTGVVGVTSVPGELVEPSEREEGRGGHWAFDVEVYMESVVQ